VVFLCMCISLSMCVSHCVCLTMFMCLSLFPNRFATMVRLASFGSLGYLLVVSVLRRPDISFFPLIVQGVVVANVFGAITAHRLHVAKRREYLRLIGQRDLNDELRSLNVELEAFATTDSLTGINNRRNFFLLAKDEVARSRRYQRPLTALMIDIDRFKDVIRSEAVFGSSPSGTSYCCSIWSRWCSI